MARADRAKIFMPFNPLKGFHEELRRREERVEAAQTHAPWLPEDDAPKDDPLDSSFEPWVQT